MPPRFTIRSARETDLPALLGLIRELAVYEKLEHEVTATPALLREHLFGPRPVAEALLAIVDGEPVAMAVFFLNFSTFLGKPGLYLEDLYVRPAHRRAGIGKALIVEGARIAKERGCGRYEWVVLDWNQSAIRFYQSLGAEMKADWRIMRVTGESLRRLAG